MTFGSTGLVLRKMCKTNLRRRTVAEYTTNNTYNTGKYWLEQGWYTAEQLQKIIDTHIRANEYLRNSMQPIKEKK
jgi:hypothetical protein